MDTSKIKDYVTTLALAAIPVIVAYQGEIGKIVPVEYALGFTILIGIASQLTANARVKEAYNDTSAGLDLAQKEARKYQQKIEELQAQIDAGQTKVEEEVMQ